VTVPKTTPSPQDPGAVKALKNFKDKVQSGIQKYRGGAADPRPQRQPHTNDFSRLARRICGKSIGVVLGGGGARGISHLVSISLRIVSCEFTASRDYSVHWRNSVSPLTTLPVSETFVHSSSSTYNMNDPGTSIGAFVGGLYAREGDIIYSASRAKQFSGRMSNIWRMLSDVTYPIVAYTTVTCVFLIKAIVANYFLNSGP
jgi:lysophospholipid hydrolase